MGCVPPAAEMDAAAVTGKGAGGEDRKVSRGGLREEEGREGGKEDSNRARS